VARSLPLTAALEPYPWSALPGRARLAGACLAALAGCLAALAGCLAALVWPGLAWPGLAGPG